MAASPAGDGSSLRGVRRRGWRPVGPVGAALGLCALLLATACRPDPAPLLEAAQVAAVFQELHRPVYGIYAIGPDRDAIHDLLASSFSGRELTREYVEHYATLVRMQQERTSIDVVRVDYERVEAIEIGPEQIRVDADWSVGGIITHRNHKHPRVNRYRAVYTLARGDDGIRIVSTRMRNLQRMRTPVVNAGDWPFDEGEGSGGGFLDPVDYLMSGMYDKDKAAPAGGQPTDPFALPVEPTGQPADPFGLEVGEPTGQEGSP